MIKHTNVSRNQSRIFIVIVADNKMSFGTSVGAACYFHTSMHSIKTR